VWRDPAPGGGPPNNWLAMFGVPSWTLDDRTGQYYYHAFLPQQPDLNWRNPAVRDAMYDVLRFWFRRGIDGFRIDVITHLIEDAKFRDNPPNPAYRAGQPTEASQRPLYTVDRPELAAIIEDLRAVADEFEDRLLIGEAYLPIPRLVAYYGSGRGLHLPFNFQLITMPWEAGVIGEAVLAYERELPAGAWPNWVLGNHDQRRIASRIGEEQARVAAMLLLTLRGTPTIYYGDELGMTDGVIPPDRRVDPAWNDGSGYGRDPERTPMQWSAEPSAGFTTGEPWLPISADAAIRNVEVQRTSAVGMLGLYRRLIALRRAEPALAVGGWAPLAASGAVLAYERSAGDRDFVIALNLGPSAVSVDLRPAATSEGAVSSADAATVAVTDAAGPRIGRIVLATGLDRDDEAVSGAVALRANEGAIIRLDPE
jgi:alpha-glucosidase